jgi:Lon protease-like protein
MISRVMAGDGKFGILYHDPDETGPFMNEPGEVGTVAEVLKRQPLPGGRSLILVRGLQRFVTTEEVREGKPYYEACTALLEDLSPGDPNSLLRRRGRTLALFKALVQNLSHVPEDLPVLDVDRELSFPLAATVQMDAPTRQELLEMRLEAARLDRLDPILTLTLGRGWDGGQTEA